MNPDVGPPSVRTAPAVEVRRPRRHHGSRQSADRFSCRSARRMLSLPPCGQRTADNEPFIDGAKMAALKGQPAARTTLPMRGGALALGAGLPVGARLTQGATCERRTDERIGVVSGDRAPVVSDEGIVHAKASIVLGGAGIIHCPRFANVTSDQVA